MRKQNIVMALIGMIDLIMSGRHYETANPYTRPEVKTAFEALDCKDCLYSQLEAKFNRGDFDKFMKDDPPKARWYGGTPQDEARALRVSGHTYAEIASIMGVSIGKVHYLCNPDKDVEN